MEKEREIASEIIDLVCEKIEKIYGLKPKPRTDDGGTKVENPALLYGQEYYDLEDEITELIKSAKNN